MKYVWIVLGVLLSLFVSASVCLFCYLKYNLLTSEKLSSLVIQEVKEQTNIHFSCESVDLSFWDQWPFVSIVVRQGIFQVADSADAAKVLVNGRFDKLSGSIQLMSLLKERAVYLDGMEIDYPVVVWDMRGKMPQLMKRNQKKSSQLKLDINRLQVSQGRVECIGRKASYVYEQLDATAGLTVTDDSTRFALHLNSPRFSFRNTSFSLPFLSVELDSEGTFDHDFSNIRFVDTQLKVNEFPFRLEGEIENLKEGELPVANVNFQLEASALNDLLAFVQADCLPEKEAYQVDGRIALYGSVQGCLKDSVYPNLHVRALLEDGKIRLKEFKEKIQDIRLDLEINHSASQADSCYMNLHHVSMSGMQSQIELQGQLRNYTSDSFLSADVKGNIDFDCIGKQLLKDSLTLEGKVQLDAHIACSVNDLLQKNFHLIKGVGKFDAHHVRLHDEEKKIQVFIPDALMNLGYAQNASDFHKTEEVISGMASADTLYLSYRDSLFLNVGGFQMRSNTAVPEYAGQLASVTIHADCRMLEVKWGRSAFMAADKVEVHVGSKSNGRGFLQGEGAIAVKTDRLNFLDPYKQQAFFVDKFHCMAELQPNVEKQAGKQKYKLKGVLEFDKSQMYLPQFPLLTSMSHAYVNFQDNKLFLNRVHVKAGKSDCLLSGALELPSAEQKKLRTLEGSMRILSDNMDYDELLQALTYAHSTEKLKQSQLVKSWHLKDLEKQLQTQIQGGQQVNHPLYLPKELDLDLQFDVNRMNYKNVELQQVHGQARLKGQTLKTKLDARTNFGKGEVDLLYDSRQKEKVTACFDLRMKDMLVAQLHQVIPTVQVMFPLLESMNGLVDCRLTAFSVLDNQMLPVWGETNAVCSLEGRNVTLLDNETFRTIANRFRFKNKQENLIDYIAANLILHKSRIEVLPFPLEWDRYKAIVGGEHGIDSTFNYHIDLLKSPIPIDVGLSLTGKPDEFKYKLRKCKFKDLFKDNGVLYNQRVEQKLEQIRQRIIDQLR